MPSERALCGSCITVRREQEINGGAAEIDGAVQVSPLAVRPNIGFIYPPEAVGRLQFPTAASKSGFAPSTVRPTCVRVPH
jgi:hypothetical protein